MAKVLAVAMVEVVVCAVDNAVTMIEAEVMADAVAIAAEEVVDDAVGVVETVAVAMVEDMAVAIVEDVADVATMLFALGLIVGTVPNCRIVWPVPVFLPHDIKLFLHAVRSVVVLKK